MVIHNDKNAKIVHQKCVKATFFASKNFRICLVFHAEHRLWPLSMLQRRLVLIFFLTDHPHTQMMFVSPADVGKTVANAFIHVHLYRIGHRSNLIAFFIESLSQ